MEEGRSYFANGQSAGVGVIADCMHNTERISSYVELAYEKETASGERTRGREGDAS